MFIKNAGHKAYDTLPGPKCLYFTLWHRPPGPLEAVAAATTIIYLRLPQFLYVSVLLLLLLRLLLFLFLLLQLLLLLLFNYLHFSVSFSRPRALSLCACVCVCVQLLLFVVVCSFFRPRACQQLHYRMRRCATSSSSHAPEVSCPLSPTLCVPLDKQI